MEDFDTYTDDLETFELDHLAADRAIDFADWFDQNAEETMFDVYEDG